MLDPNSLHGIIPPMCTPLTEEGEVDVDSVHRLVAFLLDGGVHGLFALGTCGEFALLTARQKRRLLQATVEAVNGRVPIIAGILDTSTRRCIENGKAAREAGVDALVLAPIYYFRPGQREIKAQFRAVRAGVGLPLLAYDIPSCVNVKLSPDTVKTLAKEGTIIGLKDSSGQLGAFRRVLALTKPDGLRVFTGSEVVVDVCLQMGAHGSVPGVANVFPAEYVEVYELASAGEWERAVQAQEELVDCFWDLISQGDPQYANPASWLGGFKSALKLKGVISTSHVSAPVHSFSPEEEERVADVLQRHRF